MNEHLIKHWKTFLLMFILVLLATNFTTFLYFTTGDKNLVQSTVAQQATKPTVRFIAGLNKYVIGDTVVVRVLLSAPTQAVNTVSGEIYFSTSTLQLVDISTKDSINTLWIPSTPYFSTTSNTIVFAGSIPNPGFQGVDGNILTLTFKAISSGSTQLRTTSLTVLSNDGAGTELDSTSQSLDINIQTPSAGTGISFAVGDINHDGKIDLRDLSILIANWGVPKNPDSDLSGDGRVNYKDLSILISKIKAP